MTKTKSRYWLISAVTLVAGLLFSCNKQDDPIPGDPVINGAVKVPTPRTVTIDVNVTNNSGLRWDMYDAIGLFLVREGGDEKSILAENSNVKARFDGNRWLVDDTVSIDDGRWIAYAYWPYDESVRINDMTVSVGTGINYLVGQSTYAFSYTENHISLQMQKLMSAVRVNMRCLDPSLKQYVQRVSIRHNKNSIPTGGSLNFVEQHINYGVYGSYSLSGLDKKLTPTYATVASFRALPLTQGAFTRYTEDTVNDNLELVVKVNDEEFVAPLAANVCQWAPGKQYDINVIMTRVGLVIDNVGCSVWLSQDIDPLDIQTPNKPEEPQPEEPATEENPAEGDEPSSDDPSNEA